MNNILTKPYTNREYAEFANEANILGQRVETIDDKTYRLYPHEILESGQIKDISSTVIYKKQLVQERKTAFYQDFMEIGQKCLRRVPKGYSSLVEAFNSMANIVTFNGILPEGSLTFYLKPDFELEYQCTQEWLITNSYKNLTMNEEEFGTLYVEFMTAWNTQEHQEQQGHILEEGDANETV